MQHQDWTPSLDVMETEKNDAKNEDSCPHTQTSIYKLY